MIHGKEEKGYFETLYATVITTLLTAMFSGFLWAIPAKVVWNLYIIQWLDPISYWQAFCIVMMLKFFRSLIRG